MDSLLGSSAAANAMPTPGLFENSCFSLTKKQRVMGFALCFGFGFLLSCLSTLSLMSPVKFATFYSLGNLMSLFSTAFLVGPMRQLKNMFARKRVVATLLYLAALITTLSVAMTTKSAIAVIPLIILQFCALVWYTASYIPYARDMLKRMVLGCFGK